MSRKKLVFSALAVIMLGCLALGIIVIRKRRASAIAATYSAPPVSTAPRGAAPYKTAETIYDGKLGTGWEDWGWGPHNLSAGPAKVVFGGYGGIIFRHATLEPHFAAVVFRFKPPGEWPEFLSVSLKSARDSADHYPVVPLEQRHVATLPDGWREALVSLTELDPDGLAFDRIAISARSSVAPDWVQLDKVALVAGEPGSEVKRNLELAVQCRAPTHPINPLIYGSAGGDWASGQTAERIGGNPTTRFNWEGGFWNAANDWFYENAKSVDLQQVLSAEVEHGAKGALTVPIIGWVAKDASSVGYPRAQFPKQRKFDPNRPEAGDGFNGDGTPIVPGSPTVSSMAAPPELIGRWIRALRERDAARGTRSVQMYILDNEPSIWDQTHHDIHPDPLTYDELLDRTLKYATEIRNADPDIAIAGPAEWGWLGYMYSGKDRVAGKQLRPDRLAHGDVPLIPWYLQQIGAHEKSTGQRLLDVLDVHFYPAGDGLYGGNARTDADAAALRIRATRALWDPSYVDESWIKEPIALIPRLKEWVNNYHPGLRVSLGEWSFGADAHISGGLATAEALGRFGVTGLDSAFYWAGPQKNTATFWAFRAFRNFDGKGGRFQDISLSTREADSVSLFASRDEGSTRLVTVLVNRDPQQTANATITLDGCAHVSAYRVFRYLAGAKELEEKPAGKTDGQRIVEELPPYSITVLDLDTK